MDNFCFFVQIQIETPKFEKYDKQIHFDWYLLDNMWKMHLYLFDYTQIEIIIWIYSELTLLHSHILTLIFILSYSYPLILAYS